MNELLTEAVVLDHRESGEFDKIIFLYTQELGKVAAKAVSARKITSKLAGHLEPLNIVKARLIQKNGGFKIVDAIALRKIKRSFEALALASFIKEMTFELAGDRKFWLAIKKSFRELEKKERASYAPLLKILGFDPKFAGCETCGGKHVTHFVKNETVFLCRHCAFKAPKNELILL
ncbi:DNA repair protein RecO [Candidatus Wolfebacteria bacterium]|nr:DNA repair protein RecO [Candidatus Wolfebacteria bacterium]